MTNNQSRPERDREPHHDDNIMKIITKKSNLCGSKEYIFEEAVSHCRWKTVLRKNVLIHKELQEPNLNQFASKSFDEIILWVYNTFNHIYGIGMLVIYDLAAGICRYNGINIDKIYIIGNGPIRAIRLLNIKAKTQKIGCLTLKYVEIPEILKVFNEKNYLMPSHIRNSNNGDDFESYICNWQKRGSK